MTARQHRPRATRGDAWDILGSYRRRAVLAILSERDNGVKRSTLARHVVALDEEKPASDVTYPEQRAAEIRLHHVDLPRLAAADLVYYDQEQGVVESEDLPLEGEEWLEMPVVEALEAWNGHR